MSILLIGQRNRYYSTQKPKFVDQQEIEEHKRVKKNIQDHYRRQLLEQMHEVNDRKRKQRERQKEIDQRYQKIFNQQQSEYQRRLQIQQNNEVFAHKNIDSQQIVKPQRKQYQITLPPVYKDYSEMKTKFSRIKTEPIYQSFQNKPIERLHTDFQRYDDYLTKTDEKMQSVEIRQRKLQEQLQNKLKQVYDLMAHSVKSFNQSQELQRIGNKLSPIKLNLEKQYRVKYSHPKPQIYYQQKQDHYKLPNITHTFKQDTLPPPVTQAGSLNPVYQSESEWKEWYAKQKLRQLQARYKKQLDLQASQLKYYRRGGTPKFKTEMNDY